MVSTHYFDRKYDIKSDETTLHFLRPGTRSPVIDWKDARVLDASLAPLATEPTVFDARFQGPLPSQCNTRGDAAELEKSLEDWIYHNRALSLLQNEALDICQRPGESEQSFRGRVDLAGRERRDAAVDEASERFQKKISRLEEKRRAVARSRDEQEDKYDARKQEELVNLGETVLGMVFGRRRRLTGVASKRRMTSTARARLEALDTQDQELLAEIATLNKEAEVEAARITREWAQAMGAASEYAVTPRRTDVSISFLGVLWLPYLADENAERPLF